MAFVPALHLRTRWAGSRSSCRFVPPLQTTRSPLTHIRPNPPRSPRMVADVDVENKAPPFSPKGMTVDDFFQRSFGDWRSQRSSHNLAWAQFEAVTSEIKIEPRASTDADVIALYEQNKVSADELAFSLAMSWEGESDWDEGEVMEGSTVMAVIKDGEMHGRLLRSVGYAETIPAIGEWEMTDDGVFILNTFYDAAAAEERIWFATPDLRMRVSQIRTSSGRGVMTASFSTEIRKLNLRE